MRALVLGVFLLASASVQAQNDQQFERFQLYTGCQPVHLVVIDLSSDALNVGLTKSSILTTVRSRLRGARIYSSEAGTPSLLVSVHVVGLAFNITLDLVKYVTDTRTDLSYPAVTWQGTKVTGTHGGESTYILQSIGPLVDTFIDGYLAVNESACK